MSTADEIDPFSFDDDSGSSEVFRPPPTYFYCIVCHKLLEDPAILPCKHFFCRKCLKAFPRPGGSRYDLFVECPRCAVVFAAAEVRADIDLLKKVEEYKSSPNSVSIKPRHEVELTDVGADGSPKHQESMPLLGFEGLDHTQSTDQRVKLRSHLKYLGAGIVVVLTTLVVMFIITSTRHRSSSEDYCSPESHEPEKCDVVCYGIRGAPGCSLHGRCLRKDLCECDHGWTGLTCNETIHYVRDFATLSNVVESAGVGDVRVVYLEADITVIKTIKVPEGSHIRIRSSTTSTNPEHPDPKYTLRGLLALSLFESNYTTALMSTHMPILGVFSDARLELDSIRMEGASASAVVAIGWRGSFTPTVEITHCDFLGNIGGKGNNTRGGALYLSIASASIRDCLFENNEAGFGGAIYHHEGALQIFGSKFVHNRALQGGALYVETAEDTVPVVSKFSQYLCNLCDTGAVYFQNLVPSVNLTQPLFVGEGNDFSEPWKDYTYMDDSETWWYDDNGSIINCPYQSFWWDEKCSMNCDEPWFAP